ncbi:MAG: hypothetical protein NMK33_01070 [Candidatus Cardinium sp.]|uniref:hypothetical protein n=1 Tax=Cardinium endosymbiont of Dermatophagoides farinae TaxID=2597823 RepID=UPI001181E075|nr:hypothetical protein [Cardinium endosymbiont of Dermatophagoides farinae]TSJ81102.1 hypothetical protein FPG78_03755 [Cardinium endosymbiont of Dermatophagoides farinae]UWW97144.1 MAG: hypothetical protein NMK33_01070 [Candidatus Cardinium sp.]
MKEQEDQYHATDTDKSIETRKIPAVLPTNMIEEIQDYCYWKNMTQDEFFYQAVYIFLENKACIDQTRENIEPKI